MHYKKMKKLLILLLILGLVLSSGIFVSAAEIEFIDNAPIPPNVRPVLIVSGSDYEMGYQYAQQIIEVFGTWYFDLRARSFTSKELTALRGHEKYVKSETPEMIDFVKGMADGATVSGAPISYDQVLAEYVGVKYYGDIETSATAVESDTAGNDSDMGCSGFAAWGSATKDGKLIIGGSGDHDILKAWRVEHTLVLFPDDGNNFIVSPPTGGGPGHPGISNKGVSYVHHGAGVLGNYKVGYGIPSSFATWHTLRYANDAIEAKQMQISYHTTDSSYQRGGLWADVNGNAFVLECKDPVVAREPGDYGEKDFIYSTNNSMVPELKEFLKSSYDWELRYVEHGGWHGYSESSVQRNLGMWNMLHNYHGQIDKGFAEMMWRFPAKAPAYATLEEAEESLYATQGVGWDMKIASMENANTAYALPDDGDEGLYYTSNGRVAPYTAPLGIGEHYYNVDPLYVFIELKLAANPKEVAEAAKKRAQFDLWDANKELTKLGYSDVAYAPLLEKFNRAAKEWVRGHWYLDLANRTSGNESLYATSKAVRAFTTCQAYAKHVYNALIPPATTPSDLGLPAWYGNWGDWAVDTYIEKPVKGNPNKKGQ